MGMAKEAMTGSFDIISCPACGAQLHIPPREVAFLCQECGKGYHLSRDGWHHVEVMFVVAEPASGARVLRPFWVLLAEMPLSLSMAWGANLAQPHLSIYVPAYDAPWERTLAMGVNLTFWQPEYLPGSSGELHGCTMTQQEALLAADLIYMRLLDQVAPGMTEIHPRRPTLLSTKITVIPLSIAEGDIRE